MPTPNIQTPTTTLSTHTLCPSPLPSRNNKDRPSSGDVLCRLTQPLTLHQLFVSAAPQQHRQRTQRCCGPDSDLWVSQWKGLCTIHGLTFHAVNSLRRPYLCCNLRHYLTFNSGQAELTMRGQFCAKRFSRKSKDSNLKSPCSAQTCSFPLSRWMLERDYKDVSWRTKD